MMMIVNKFDDDWRHRNEGIKKTPPDGGVLKE